MKYTIQDLNRDFPDDAACLEYIFRRRFPAASEYRRISTRKAYVNPAGHQINPLAGTIFHKSRTPLSLWFHALFLFSVSKNGVSAKELERQIGVTYKCAFRMARQIRSLMTQGTDILSGTLEADETYYGKTGKNAYKFKNKQAVLGVVERGGRIRVETAPNRRLDVVLPFIKKNVATGSHIVTDEYHGYRRLSSSGYRYRHSEVKHGKHHFSWKGQHTNTIEGFWGGFKRSVRGTYVFVSKQHLQEYLNEFAWRYNERSSSRPLFEKLLESAAR